MATAGAKVIVACKMGIPWLDLQLCEKRKVMENTQTGPREVEQFVRSGNVVRIRGTSYPRGTPPVGFPEKPQMFNGYALTQGVDKDFWEKWAEQNKRTPFVISGMLKAFDSIDTARGYAKEHASELSGLEPLNPNGDARVPRSSNGAIANVETENERKGKLVAAVA